MDFPQDLTSDPALLKIASEDGEDTIEPRPRRKSILKLAPEALLAAHQRRPSKRVAFADEEAICRLPIGLHIEGRQRPQGRSPNWQWPRKTCCR